MPSGIISRLLPAGRPQPTPIQLSPSSALSSGVQPRDGVDAQPVADAQPGALLAAHHLQHHRHLAGEVGEHPAQVVDDGRRHAAGVDHHRERVVLAHAVELHDLDGASMLSPSARRSMRPLTLMMASSTRSSRNCS